MVAFQDVVLENVKLTKAINGNMHKLVNQVVEGVKGTSF